MLDIQVRCCVSEEIRRRNIGLSAGIPEPSGTGRLFIVGGGSSLRSAVHLIPDTDIWAINGTARYLLGVGLKRVFLYSVDPAPLLAEFCDGIDQAVLAAHCDPSAFKAMEGKTVYRVDAFECPGPTSAVAAMVLGIRHGWEAVDFYGCDSSFDETTHVYRDEPVPGLMRVRCGGELFMTSLELLAQAKNLAEVIRRFPKFYTNKSGGLLAALIEHEHYEITDVSRQMIIERKEVA